MAELPQIQTPSIALSEKTKKRLRDVDEARPYLHRAAMFALPAMAGANYLTPLRHAEKKHAIIAGIGAAGAGLGLLDRKIEQLAEEHAELRPTLKNYSRHSPGTSTMNPAKLGFAEKSAGILNVNPVGAAKGLSSTTKFFRSARPAMYGAGIGAVGGALGNSDDRVGGALTGAVIGGAAGGAATGLTRMFSKNIQGAQRMANAAARKGTPVSLGDYANKLQTGAEHLGGELVYRRPTGLSGGRRVSKAGRGRAATAPAETAPATTAAPAATAAPAHPEHIQAILSKPGHTRDAAEVFQLRRYNSENGLKLGNVGTLTEFLRRGASKVAGINTMHDAHRAIGGRPPYALLTMGGETSNDAVINQMLRALFANTDAMRKATEDQVLAAFPLSAPYSYGRHRAIGRTADDIKAEIALAYTPTQR